MKKLTKEQADWLLKKIKPSLCKSAQSNAGVITYDGFMNFIENQCTEKEFPEFGMATAFFGYVRMNECHDLNVPGVAIWNADVRFVLTDEQFKKFTDGCLAICKWIEEQE